MRSASLSWIIRDRVVYLGEGCENVVADAQVQRQRGRGMPVILKGWDWLKHGQIARFIEPIGVLACSHIPEGNLWTYELKLDGYRAIAVKSGGRRRSTHAAVQN